MHNNALTIWRIESKQYHILSIHNKYAIMIVLKVHLHSYMYIHTGQSTVTVSFQQPVTKPASQQSPVTISQQHDTTTSDGKWLFIHIQNQDISYISSSCNLQAIQSKMLSYYINMSFQESVLNGKLLLHTWSIVLPQRRQSIRQTGDYPGIAVQNY